jgi:branched-chain amino acid transport system substrate-binding protein
LVGAGGFVTQTFIDLAQGEGEGVVALEPGLDIDSMPGGKAFKKEYEERFKIPVEVHSPFAYDGVGALVQAIKSAGSIDPPKLVAELHRQSYQGVTGVLSYDSEGNVKNPVFTIYQVVGGAWKPVATVGGGK